METYRFNQCDCEFPCSGKGKDFKIYFEPHIDKIPLDCKATWDLISDGNTKGVFQLESRFGQKLAKELKPRNIEHLGALTAIMRPGCSEAIREGKSVTQHYIDKKNGIEPVSYFHPALEDSLSTTYGEMIYQEQAMQIARDIAGFTLEEADILRKAIGKKKADIMSKIEKMFLDGCAKVGKVDEQTAKEIFEWIRKSQRYSFNKSHSISYAINAYLSAYAKAHFRRAFFTSYLFYAKEKAKPHEEIRELVNNAKSMDVEVYPPDLRKKNEHFALIDKNIYFGLVDIKGIGESAIKKIYKEIDYAEERLGKSLEDWCWIDFLVMLSQNIKKDAVEALIKTGAISWMNISRQAMWFEFEKYSALSIKEQQWIEKRYEENKDFFSENGKITLLTILRKILSMKPGRASAISNKNRAAKIDGVTKLVATPPTSLEDTAMWISSIEESLMGIPITCTVVDACDTSAANATCADFISGQTRKNGILIAAKIDSVKETKTKKGKTPGQTMAFLSVSDISGSIESCVLFPTPWKQNKDRVFVGNTVMIGGEKGKEAGSLIIQKIWQI